MKAKELKDRSKEELQAMLLDSQAQLNQLKFDVSARQVKNHRETRWTRRTIARIETLLKSHH